VQSALTAPCRSSCRTVEDFLDCHADHRLPRSVGTLAPPRWSVIRAKDMPSARITLMWAIKACSVSLAKCFNF
jgi:hypothetical protein